MKFDDGLLRPDANNLTLLRLVLASSVIYTHCYWMLTGRAGEDDLSFLLGAPVSVYAVDSFFFLSGFLVNASLQRSAGVGNFLLARLTRLWPALALSVGLTVLAGYIFTVDRSGYFGGATLKFMTHNLSLVAPAYHLTGVLCDGQPCTMNGSLWTLPWEARCYLLLVGLA
ncbi:MAG: acyltransferase family protein, partial [Alphaproteobacteria bacterium]|nr:acyltransferase family protein [Alphaproteobacteria bacterium]